MSKAIQFDIELVEIRDAGSSGEFGEFMKPAEPDSINLYPLSG